MALVRARAICSRCGRPATRLYRRAKHGGGSLPTVVGWRPILERGCRSCGGRLDLR